jgi:hypothetical protein
MSSKLFPGSWLIFFVKEMPSGIFLRSCDSRQAQMSLGDALICLGISMGSKPDVMPISQVSSNTPELFYLTFFQGMIEFQKISSLF